MPQFESELELGEEAAELEPFSLRGLDVDLQRFGEAARGVEPPCLTGRKLVRETLWGYPTHHHSVASLRPAERMKIPLIARLIVNSFRLGCQPVRKVNLVGHADRDPRAGATFEKKISQVRADQVQKALVAAIDQLSGRFGPSRGLSPLSRQIAWKVRGVGASENVVKRPRSESERARNRRLEIFLALGRAGRSIAPTRRESELSPFPTPVTPAPTPSPGAFPAFWKDLISFRPPTSIQNAVNSRFGVRLVKPKVIHFIEDANGPINLDFYPVVVRSLPMIPTIPGRVSTPDEFLTHIRLNINSFIDTGQAGFEPYDLVMDGPKWTSLSPEGAVIHIDMRLGSQWANPDDGSVVVSRFAADHWLFSTLWTPGDLDHPVSGNRQFGFLRRQDPDDPSKLVHVFYTRGADRPTGVVDNLGSALIFSAAHSLWKSFQDKIESYVNGNGGRATKANPISERRDWDAVKRVYFSPTTPRV